MTWTRFDDGRGFAFEHPAGWQVRVGPAPSCVVSSPDGLWVALIQPLAVVAGVSPADVIRQGRYPTAGLFPAATVSGVGADDDASAEGDVAYRAVDGSPGRAHLVYVDCGDGIGLLCGVAAPAAAFDAAVPVLSRILRSQNRGRSDPAADPVGVPVPQFAPFRDPERGSFTADVPVGWRAAGGLHHPSLGDVRPWLELTSPDGVHVAVDPAFPQALCHRVGVADGLLVDQPAGGRFLNVRPSAEGSADAYLAHVGPRRLGGFRRVGRRPRPDAERWVRAAVADAGHAMGRGSMVAAIETLFDRSAKPGGGPGWVGSVLTTAAFNGQYAFGLSFWGTANVVCVAPAALAGVADAVRARVLQSMRPTPAMHAIHQQDAAQIQANTDRWVDVRWRWFAGQQHAHQAQVAAGDAVVSGYWDRQRADDRIARGWEQAQAVYDRLSEDRSDATMDRQRLADDAGGHTYDVPAGSNYYWLDPHGQVVGTTTDQPPDWGEAYTALRKV